MIKNGGKDRIRTCGRVAPTHAFQACALNHSATFPCKIIISYFAMVVKINEEGSNRKSNGRNNDKYW